jgi:hypothetical protein
MANQKISDLNSISKPEDLTAEDLLIVVDSDEKTSPSGETKKISAEVLATALTMLSVGKLGISFTNLKDTPDAFELDNNGNFIKVKVDQTQDGEPVGELEFVDSPGASEQTFRYDGNFETDDLSTTNIDEGHFFVGALVRRSISGKFAIASANDPERAECVGIIKKIKRDSESKITHITIVFNGYVEFQEDDDSGISVLSSYDPVQSAKTTNLQSGVVYFLGSNGLLYDNDPSATGGDGNSNVSKPVLIGAGGMRGFFVNYRGMYNPEDEEANKFIIEKEESCADFEIGDIVRISTITGDFVMSSAEDFDTSDVLGIVISASTNHYVVQTNGMVTFDLPSDREEVNESLHFIPGTQYYLTDLDIMFSDNEKNTPRYSLHEWAYKLDDATRIALRKSFPAESESSARKTPVNGTPFRNSQPTDPASPLVLKDGNSGYYETFSRPVFYAIAKNRILLTNHRTLPNPHLECFDCLKNSETVKSIFWPNYPTGDIEPTSFSNSANAFLTKIWPSAGNGHVATLYDNNENTSRWRYSLNKWERFE